MLLTPTKASSSSSSGVWSQRAGSQLATLRGESVEHHASEAEDPKDFLILNSGSEKWSGRTPSACVCHSYSVLA